MDQKHIFQYTIIFFGGPLLPDLLFIPFYAEIDIPRDYRWSIDVFGIDLLRKMCIRSRFRIQ